MPNLKNLLHQSVLLSFSSLLLVFQTYTENLSAQPCFPQDAFFYSQSEIDSFPVLHPNCDTVLGSVWISGSDIVNLNGLSGIEQIEGGLYIWNIPAIDTLEGLDSLKRIGGMCVIGHDATYYPGPSMVRGFNNLERVDSDFIFGKMTDLQFIDGFSRLSRIGGDLYLFVNPDLEEVNGFTQLDTVEGYFGAYKCGALKHVEGCSGMRWVGENLSFVNCNSLNSLAYLHPDLQIGGSLNLNDCPSLEQLMSLSNMTCFDGDVYLADLGIKDLTGFDSIKVIRGDLEIINNGNLLNITALRDLDSVFSDLNIGGNPEVKYLNGLQNLKYVGKGLIISYMTRLRNLSAFASLSHVRSLKLYSNELLENIQGLSSLERVDYIHLSDNKNLRSLDGLENVRMSFGGINIRANPRLNSISALEHVDADSIYLVIIEENDSLSFCAIKPFCEILHSPSPMALFDQNGQGCLSNNQVIQNCIDIGLDIEELDKVFSVYPNPLDSKGILRFDPSLTNAAMTILDCHGRRVWDEINYSGNELDLNKIQLSQGVYFLRIIHNDVISSQKLLIR